MTPEWVAKDVMAHFPHYGVLMEPCRGDGAFHKLMPPDARWCEIREGVDFYKYDGPQVDWIITNPPYSTFDQFLQKAIEVADNLVLLIPANKIFASYNRLQKVYEWGGIKEIRYYGAGRSIGFPFGFAVIAVWLQKSYLSQNMEVSFAPKPIVDNVLQEFFN